MFTFVAMPVKFVGLLVMFVFTTAWSGYELTRPQSRRQRISNGLHLMMSLVMVLMVPTMLWLPFVGLVGMPVLIAAFAASTVWFAWLAVDARGSRGALLHFAGHAMMFAAMTWHLAAMGIMRAAMAGSGMGHGAGGTSMAGWRAQASVPGGPLWMMALVGVPFMTYLLVAGVNDVVRALRPREAPHACHCGADCACGSGCACQPPVPASDEVREHVASRAGQTAGTVRVRADLAASCHELRPVGSPRFRLAALSDAAMNLGMFWMSTGLMVPILPFFAMLSF